MSEKIRPRNRIQPPKWACWVLRDVRTRERAVFHLVALVVLTTLITVAGLSSPTALLIGPILLGIWTTVYAVAIWRMDVCDSWDALDRGR